MSENYFPPLLGLIPLDKLPFKISEDATSGNPLNIVRYNNLYKNMSRDGEVMAYNVDLMMKDALSFDIPGLDGFKFIINPDIDNSDYQSFNTDLFFSWPVLKYVKGFSIDNFSEGLDAFFYLAKDIFGIDEKELFVQGIQSFYGGQSGLQTFITNFNATSPAVPIDLNASAEDVYGDIIAQITSEDNGYSILAVIFDFFINNADSLSDVFNNLGILFSRATGDVKGTLKKLMTPYFRLALNNLSVGLSFPTKILKQVDPATNEPLVVGGEFVSPILKVNLGQASYDTRDGFDFKGLDNLSIDFPKSEILDSGFLLSFSGAKLDLSRTKNIPEADADGRPRDFIGVYIQDATIGFPTDWGHDPDDPETTAELFVENFLAGTGGISGKIGMRGTGSDPENGIIKAQFGSGFEVGLEGFDLVFQQNAIISSDIHGWMKIPGMKSESGTDAVLDIKIHIGQGSEFNVVLSSVPALKKIKVPGAFEFGIESAFFGREQGSDGRFYLGISGKLDITVNESIGQFLPDQLDIKKMLIYDDGTFEFEGGKIVLPKAYEIKFGAATLSITGIHMGSYEKNNRKYKFFGFDGGVKVNPGGVEAHGKGIKYYYTVDGGDFDWFIRLESLSVDIIIPSGANPEDAAVTIKGFLSISEPRIPAGLETTNPALYETLKNSQEYAGGVSVKIPKFKGLEASAAMRLNPKVPAFIIDLGIEISTPILLGTTGLGIYGFRALLGKKYVATKTSAGVPEDGEWWQYYKAKIDPDFREGIQVSKFDTKNGFSFGAGVSLATASDSGKMFSSKLFFLLSLPDVFLFQGQAQFLKERIGLDANPDPPFFAIIAITKHSVEAGFGVNYKLRENGKLVTVDGVIELGFFWGNSSAWYVNVGRETPEDRRIQARLFDILNMYFYLMLSSGGIRLGAGVKFEKEKKFGPLSAELKAYIDTFGKISRRPRQIGGALKMGGKVGIKVCGFGFSVSGGATLAAEAPKPHIITGEFEVCVKVLKKERCARFEFTWDFDQQYDLTRVPLLGGTTDEENDIPDAGDAKKVAKMTHMVTGETFPLAYHSGSSLLPPAEWITGGADDYRVPVDAFMDIEFKKGVKANSSSGNNLGRLGGLSSPAKYIEFSPPIRGKSDRVRHEFSLENIEIMYWDETTNQWHPYDFYEAMNPLYDNANDSLVSAVDPALLQSLKWGYWQQQDPGVNNKLRLLAMTPLSFAASSGDAYTIEDLGINDQTILCPGELIQPTCIIYDDASLYSVYPANTMRVYENVLFRVLNDDGTVINIPFSGFDNGLFMMPGDTMELFFNEPMKEVSLLLNTESDHVTITFYTRKAGDPDPLNNLPTYTYDLVKELVFDDYTFSDPIDYSSEEYSIDYITITADPCPKGASTLITTPVDDQATILDALHDFLNLLVINSHLTETSVELYHEHSAIYGDFFTSPLYGRTPNAEDVITLTQGHISPVSMSFTIADNHGFDCLYTFNMIAPIEGFDFAHVSEITDFIVHPASVQGPNKQFEALFHITIGGVAKTIRFLISSCKPLSYAVSSCAVGLYKTCYLSMESYLMNGSATPPAEQTAANNVMFASINETLQPIWRPNTAFAVRIKTKDQLFAEGSSSDIVTYQKTDVYGFRTAGPVGHFHQYPVYEGEEFSEKQRTDYHALDVTGKADEYRLTTLRPYIDYSKSYPNADGSLINAKPLFYNGAELSLFYLYNHVYHFYNNWTDYEHAGPEIDPTPMVAQSSLEIRILNPAPSPVPEEVLSQGFEAGGILHAPLSAGLPPVNINSVHNDVSILNNLLLNGSPCALPQTLAPIDLSSQMKINLKPLKLYTAQFVAHYNARVKVDSTLMFAPEAYEATVHSYVFQTSRYGSFAEQVNSYILKETVADGIVRAAVFPIEVAADVDLAMAQQVINGELDATDELRVQYAEPFEQLVYGVLGVDLNQLQAAVTTEFNLVKSGEQLIGILIRNPEPFNDPKIPEDNGLPMMEAINMDTFTTLQVLYSKDRSQLFIQSGFDIPLDANLRFVFQYLKYNGVSYGVDEADIITVNLDLTNYPI